MYYVTPSIEHREAVYDFLDKCLAAGDDKKLQFGCWPFNQAVREKGYEYWLEEVTRTSHEWGKDMRHSLLLVETLEGLSSMEPDYVNQFSHIKDDLYLVGMVNIRMEGTMPSTTSTVRRDVGVFELCLLPTCRDTVSYQMALSRLQLYAVCAGLLYKHLQVDAYYCTTEGQYYFDSNSLPCNELHHCCFEGYPIGLDGVRYVCDLRLAHQLRAGIAHYKRREG